MSNITKLAPYAYLAKRSSGTVHDLLLLVPVDTSGDTDLSSVSPTKSGTRVSINYATNSNSANAPYRFKHFEIDSEGRYVDIEIKGDNDAALTTLLEFGDADTEPATVSSQRQTCAPYLFVKKETVSSTEKYAHPSCIVLFDGNLGALTEALAFNADGCLLTFTLGNSSVTTDPNQFAINKNIKTAITTDGEHTFEGIIEGNANLAKPPRKGKTSAMWGH